MYNDLEARLAQAVAARRDALISLTQDLLRIPSLNPPGAHYRTACDYLAARLEASGFSCEFVQGVGAPGDSDTHPRWNVVARRDGGRPGPCFHFSSHTDVVPVGHGWTTDPFGGALKDGRIYGRGACDMKGGLATSIIAAEAFLEVCPEFAGAVEISGTADEESGGFGGVAYLAKKGYFSPERVDYVIIPEPLNKDRICLGHRGVWWAEIETKGQIGHGSMPFLGDCAVRHMAAFLETMERELFPKLAERVSQMPVVPDGARAASLNINAIHGGEPEQASGYSGLPVPCVPDRCRIVIDRRFLIEEDLGAVKAEVLDLLDGLKASRPGFDYTIRDLHEVIPTMTDRAAPVVQTVSRAITKVLGRAPEYIVSPGTYDQKHVDRIGGLKNCIAYGPGILDLAHQPDEWIGVDDMIDGATVMALALGEVLAPART